MVTKYSTNVPVIQPIASIDPNLAYKALSKLQGSFDSGFLSVQEKVNKQAEMDLLRKQDIDYANKKIAETTDTINQLGNIDYADIKLTSALGSDIDRISQDAVVKKGLLSTANFRQYQKRLGQLKENPKLAQYWNPNNEAWDMRQVDKYVNGETDRLDLNSPTLYVDVNKELGEKLSKMKGQAWDDKKNGFVLNGVRVTEAEVEEAAKAALTSDARYTGQIQINAWAKYRNVPDESILNQYRGTVQANIEQSLIEQEQYEKAMNTAMLGNSEADKMAYEIAKQKRDAHLSKLDYWKAENSKLSNPDPAQRYSGDDLKYKYELENTVNSMGNLYSWSKSKVEADPYQILQAKFAQQVKLNQMKFEHEKEIVQYKATFGPNATGKKAGATSTGFENAPLVPMMDSQPEELGDKNYYQEYTDKVKAYQNTNFDILKSTIAKIFDARGMFTSSELIKGLKSGGDFDTAGDSIKASKEFKESGLDNKGKVELFNLYNGIINTYNDARDGKIDNYDVRVFKPDVRENMNLVAQNANASKRLQKQLEIAQNQTLQEVYGGNKALYESDLKGARPNDTSPAAYQKYLQETAGTENVYSFEDWKKNMSIATTPDRLRKYNETLGKSISGSQSVFGNYLMAEGQLGKENYDTITSMTAGIAMDSGIRKSGKPDVYAYKGKIAGVPAKNQFQDMDTFAGAESIVPIKYDAVTGKMQVEIKFPKDSKTPSEVGYVQLNPAQQQEMINKGIIPKKDFYTKITEEANFNAANRINGGATERYWTTNADIPFEWQVKKIDGGYMAYLHLDKKAGGVGIISENGVPFSTGEEAARQLEMYINFYVTQPEVQKIPNTQDKKAGIFNIIAKDSRIKKVG